MSTEPRIPGIPTRHKGRQYRSRLEARWATFFDLLGWKYEYEPFDLDGWIPDFVLFGAETVVVEDEFIAAFSGVFRSKSVALCRFAVEKENHRAAAL